MHHREEFAARLSGADPVLALAPMQAITDLRFWRLAAAYGGPDVYYTEYFRVHAVSRLDRDILRSVMENPTRRPLVAQLIGNDIPSLVRTARELQEYPIVAVDLNLGCPAPVVYRKCAGSGLLRRLDLVDSILGALRDAVRIKFTVKTRIGFDSPAIFDDLLRLVARHSIDLVTVHGRLVPQGNSGPVNYDLIARAVQSLPCPVLANGDVHSAANAADILQHTGAKGLMVGRGAVRNPWLFSQIRQHQRGEQPFIPHGRDVLRYIHALCDALRPPDLAEETFVAMMKKYLNFIGDAVEPTGRFLHEIRRVTTEAHLFAVCTTYLDHDRPMPLVPFSPAASDSPAPSPAPPTSLPAAGGRA